MCRLSCKDPNIEKHCRKLSCVYPGICQNLNSNHQPLIDLYKKSRNIDGIKRVHIASGVRYDLAAHPGTTDKDMLNLALWLKKYDLRADQVQAFMPPPCQLQPRCIILSVIL